MDLHELPWSQVEVIVSTIEFNQGVLFENRKDIFSNTNTPLSTRYSF